MSEARWTTELRQRALLTERMILDPGDPGPLPVTKVGGSPWWPSGEARPRCRRSGHLLSFIAQIVLSDDSQLSPDEGLLSFHYCVECEREGFMSFGAADPGGPDGGYDLRVFQRGPGVDSDGVGAVAKSSIPPYRISLSAVEEIPSWAEYGDDLRKQIPQGASIAKDDLDENV